MKLTELIEDLKDIEAEHGDMDIYVARDEEGNGFNPLYGIDVSPMLLDDPSEISPIHPDDLEMHKEDYGVESFPLGLVIWP